MTRNRKNAAAAGAKSEGGLTEALVNVQAAGEGNVDPGAAPAADTGSADARAQHAANPDEVMIYPRRTYEDRGSLRRRGGAGYVVPRRHGDELINRGLASAEKPEA